MTPTNIIRRHDKSLIGRSVRDEARDVRSGDISIVEVSLLRSNAESVFAAFALMLLLPLLSVIGVAIVLETGWPVLFRQTRVGRNGSLFRIVKFRTMRANGAGPSLTVSGDLRVTRVGGILRKLKLDEIPQLWNVVRGEMGLVGPRPEVPDYVDMKSPIWRAVLKSRPGITDPVSIMYRNEEALLSEAADPIEFYRKTLLPTKLSSSLSYLQKRSLWLDMKVIVQTAHCALFPRSGNSGQNQIRCEDSE
jgi:lipopolysaccharide/colanic/teichoic acid biosynthesis glycosyltransferase